MTRTVEVACGALLLVLVGCEPELPPFRVAYEGCELYTDAPVELSEALPREHCAFGERLSASLGLPNPSSELRYGLYEHESQPRSFCSRGAPACAHRGYVLSTEPLHAHELVHSTLLSHGRWGASALQEGAAEVFGCGPSSPSVEVDPALSIEQLVDHDAFYDAGLYIQARSFVSFLLDLEGETTFAELLVRTDPGSGLDTLNGVLLELYGSDAAELLAQWTALGPQPLYRLCRRVYECGAPAWAGDGTLVLDRGVARDIAHAGAIRTLTVEHDATLRIRADAVGAEVRVLSCDRQPDVVPEAGHWSASDDEAAIGPGRYAVWVTGLVLEGDQSSVAAEVSIAIE